MSLKIYIKIKYPFLEEKGLAKSKIFNFFIIDNFCFEHFITGLSTFFYQHTILNFLVPNMSYVKKKILPLQIVFF